jgi:hypothetical protein
VLQRTNNARELCAHDKFNTITQATGTTLESGVLERCCPVACEVVRKRGASTQRDTAVASTLQAHVEGQRCARP